MRPMPRFLVAIHHRDDYDPSTEDSAMGKAIDDLNDDMIAAGVRVFVGGLHHASTAHQLRLLADGSVAESPGSYLPTDEHVAGFWVLDVASLDDALEWGRRAAVACRAPVEVRQFHW